MSNRFALSDPKMEGTTVGDIVQLRRTIWWLTRCSEVFENELTNQQQLALTVKIKLARRQLAALGISVAQRVRNVKWN